ncbi:hypothetical protein CSUI_002145 [Cystoisospora suis]|uniref:Uncharacterized protein n=1 Tax=Cystoisospora suis TaxID=483139 RepID=A0A2C6LA43_9APIC|nr:hypothetical protein CSUI_002145 [Cystoisospora suis]
MQARVFRYREQATRSTRKVLVAEGQLNEKLATHFQHLRRRKPNLPYNLQPRKVTASPLLQPNFFLPGVKMQSAVRFLFLVGAAWSTSQLHWVTRSEHDALLFSSASGAVVRTLPPSKLAFADPPVVDAEDRAERTVSSGRKRRPGPFGSRSLAGVRSLKALAITAVVATVFFAGVKLWQCRAALFKATPGQPIVARGGAATNRRLSAADKKQCPLHRPQYYGPLAQLGVGPSEKARRGVTPQSQTP